MNLKVPGAISTLGYLRFFEHRGRKPFYRLFAIPPFGELGLWNACAKCKPLTRVTSSELFSMCKAIDAWWGSRELSIQKLLHFLLATTAYSTPTEVVKFKPTVPFQKEWLGLPCLVPLLTWLYVSDYRHFWSTEWWWSLNLEFTVKTIVLVTKTSSRMASTLCPKWLTSFCQQNSKVSIVWMIKPYDFVQMSPACGPITYQIMCR